MIVSSSIHQKVKFLYEDIIIIVHSDLGIGIAIILYILEIQYTREYPSLHGFKFDQVQTMTLKSQRKRG